MWNIELRNEERICKLFIAVTCLVHWYGRSLRYMLTYTALQLANYTQINIQPLKEYVNKL